MTCNLTLRRCICTIITTLIVVSPTVAALTPDQTKLLQQAQSHLKQAIDNYNLALQSAGKGTPKGSKAKLAMMRLNSAKAPIPQIEAILPKLPADDPSVKAVADQYNTLKNAVNDLEQRITGKSAAENAQADVGVKLDYKQEEQLKNARYYLREIAGMDAALKGVVEKVNATEDKSTFDNQELQKGMNTVAKSRERAKNVATHLEDLPADGRGVKAAHDDLQKSMASIEGSYKTLQPVYEHVMGLINPANYPTLTADIDRLGDLAGMYGNPNVLLEDPERAAALVAEAQAASTERERLVKKYAIFITQKTETGKRLFGLNRHFVDQYYRFGATAKERQENLPGEIQKQLDEAADIAAQAIRDEKPMFFTGGIPHVIKEAERKMVLYKSLDPAGAETYQKKLDGLRETLKEQQHSLRGAIIASNKLPPDEFKGADRDAVAKLAADAWTKDHPGATILATRIPSQAWKHELIWRTNKSDSWYKIDRSRLQVQLIVKHDDKLASIQPINLWKDHLQGDTITAFPLHEKGYEPQPQSLMLIEKVK